ncbi:TPA: hypothetical protein DCG61_02565 [Patescibacteria group bacterium]|nr:hypothetical protein [Patescibacteria group bacterium]
MTNLEVYEAEENVVFDHVVDVWRWGAVWEKVVERDGVYFALSYKTGQSDMGIELEDMFNTKGSAKQVNLIKKEILVIK